MRSSWRTLVLAAAVLVLAAPAFSEDLAAASRNCRPAAPQRGSNCSKDSQCCAGLVCQSGDCRSGCRVGGVFYTAEAKNPSNACQSCQPSLSTTSFRPVANGASCSDGNACTQADTCQGGVCLGGNLVACSAQDQCHTAGTCSPSTGVCSNPSKPNGTSCNDGNACSQTDTCQGGVCLGGNLLACSAQDECHAAGACNPSTGLCSNPSKPDGTSCSDGNACTGSDRCLAGVCTPLSLTVCLNGDACHDNGTCDPATGLCSRPPRPDGTACNDGSACTTLDTCQGGACTGFGPVICQPPDNCHDQGACDSATGRCVYAAKPDGTACSDGNGCSVGDTCQNGVCTGAPIICPPSIPSGCYGSTTDCNPMNGQCYPRPVLNGTPCDDGNACTSGDACHQGECTGTPCASGQECCAAGDSESCKDLGFDSDNCGACGQVCQNSACMRGQCYDGCVIGGVGYRHGTRDPANDCQICDVGLSRSSWTALGSDPNTTDRPTCHVGCFSGFCFAGACGSLGGSGGCQSTTCAAVSCVNGACAATPINEGASCVPPLSNNACKSGSGGTCHDGDCIADNANEGGFCVPTGPAGGISAECRSLVAGACHQGTCVNGNVPNGTVCHHVGTGNGLCMKGTCNNGECPSVSPVDCTIHDYCGENGTCNNSTGLCVFPQQDPPPSGGQISCNLTGALGSDPSKCCPGQVCICAPTPTGIPNFCLFYGCWTPSDVPHGYP